MQLVASTSCNRSYKNKAWISNSVVLAIGAQKLKSELRNQTCFIKISEQWQVILGVSYAKLFHYFPLFFFSFFASGKWQLLTYNQ